MLQMTNKFISLLLFWSLHFSYQQKLTP